MRGITERWRQDRGATAAEYAVIVSLIAVVAIAGIVLLGDSVLGLFTRTADSIADATNG